MATSERFEKLEELHSAISRIDTTISVPETNNLESVLDVVRDIPKKEFPKEYQDAMISNIRNALVQLYTDEVNLLSERIGITIPAPVPAIPVIPEDQLMKTVPWSTGTPNDWPPNPIFTCSSTATDETKD